MALCTRCGRQTDDAAEFCSGCGSYPGFRGPERPQTVAATAGSAGYLRPFAAELGSSTALRAEDERGSWPGPDSPPGGNPRPWALQPASPSGQAPDFPPPRSPDAFAGNGGALDEFAPAGFRLGNGSSPQPTGGGFSPVPRGPFEPARPADPQEEPYGGTYPAAPPDEPHAGYPDAYPAPPPDEPHGGYPDAYPAPPPDEPHGGYPDAYPAPPPDEPHGGYPDAYPAPPPDEPHAGYPDGFPAAAPYFPADAPPEPVSSYPAPQLAGYQPAPVTAPERIPADVPLTEYPAAAFPSAGFPAAGAMPAQSYQPAGDPGPGGLPAGEMPTYPTASGGSYPAAAAIADDRTGGTPHDLLAGPAAGYVPTQYQPASTWPGQAAAPGTASQPAPTGPVWAVPGTTAQPATAEGPSPQFGAPAESTGFRWRRPVSGDLQFPPESATTSRGAARNGRWISVAAAAVVLVICAATAMVLLSHDKPTGKPGPAASHAASPRRPEPAAAPSPGRLITVGPAAGGANAPAVVTFLTHYFTAINKHDFPAYRRLFSTSLRGGLSEAAFIRGYGTTQDTQATLHGITTVGSGELNAAVTFTSHQQPAASPNHSGCTAWSISLFLVRRGSEYVLVSPPAGYQGSFSTCS